MGVPQRQSPCINRWNSFIVWLDKVAVLFEDQALGVLFLYFLLALAINLRHEEWITFIFKANRLLLEEAGRPLAIFGDPVRASLAVGLLPSDNMMQVLLSI